MTRLMRAQRIASCGCYIARKGGLKYPPDMRGFFILDWTCRNEYWNPPDLGHLIAASLALDGYPVTDKKRRRAPTGGET